MIAVATKYYLVLITFLTAYIHPTRAVTVTIDDYNETELELVFMLLSLPSAVSFILENLKKHPREKSVASAAIPLMAPSPTYSTPSVTP